MLTRLISIFLFCLVATTCHSQYIFDSDSTYEPLFQSTITKIGSIFNLPKNPDFELRFWTSVPRTMEERLFILIFEGNKVTGKLFKRTRHQKDTLVELLVNQNDLIHLWKKLKQLNVLSIPDASTLKNKKGEEAYLPIHDGISYVFELLTQDKKRSYWYTCPKVHAKQYRRIKDFRRVARIIELIEKYCGLKVYSC